MIRIVGSSRTVHSSPFWLIFATLFVWRSHRSMILHLCCFCLRTSDVVCSRLRSKHCRIRICIWCMWYGYSLFPWYSLLGSSGIDYDNTFITWDLLILIDSWRGIWQMGSVRSTRTSHNAILSIFCIGAYPKYLRNLGTCTEFRLSVLILEYFIRSLLFFALGCYRNSHRDSCCVWSWAGGSFSLNIRGTSLDRDWCECCLLRTWDRSWCDRSQQTSCSFDWWRSKFDINLMKMKFRDWGPICDYWLCAGRRSRAIKSTFESK